MSRVEAMSLSDKLSLRYSESVLKARERMQRFYSSRDQLHLCAGFGKGKTLPMEQVAVNVCLLSEGEARAAFGGRFFKVENNSFELTRIFKESFIDQR